MFRLVLFLGIFLTFISSAQAQQLHRENIVSITEKGIEGSNIVVEVIFWLQCGDQFVKINASTVPPYSLSNPYLAVEVLATSIRMCTSADMKSHAFFMVNRIAGKYTYIPMQP